MTRVAEPTRTRCQIPLMTTRHLELTHDSETPLVRDRRLARLHAYGRMLDTAFGIPGTRFRFGVDALLGLVPGLGDAAGALLSAYIVFEAARYGAPRATLLRMLWNVGVETVIGIVPIIGDYFDAAYKANIRNLRLLDRHVERPAETARSSRRFVVLVVAGLTLFVIALVAVSVALGVLLSREIAQRF